jgi:hypothetical protein
MEIDHVLIRVADLDAASHALDAEHSLSTVGSYHFYRILRERGCSPSTRAKDLAQNPRRRRMSKTTNSLGCSSTYGMSRSGRCASSR